MKTKLLTESDVKALTALRESEEGYSTDFMSKVEEIARRMHVSMAEVMAEFAPSDDSGLTMEEGFAQLASS